MELQSLPGILFLLLAVVTLVQLIYYLFIYRKLFVYKQAPAGPSAGKANASDQPEPVSVIIAARNEAANLEKNLPRILSQDYPDFEVIVANDCSYDRTEDVLKALQREYPRLRIVSIPENDKYRHGKKFALTMGIKAAVNETLLFTDADCYPLSPAWIRTMQAGYDGADTEIVLGTSPYEKLGGFLNAFIRYETFLTALNYLSFALSGMPYMGVGRNLSYKKSLFFKHKGFASHLHLKSGDDDLFVNQAAHMRNTRIVFSPDSQTCSSPEQTWRDYFLQKRRHQSVGKYYKGRHKFLLGTHAVSAMAFYVLLFVLVGLKWNPIALGVVAGIKWLVQYLVFFPAMKRMKAGDLWFFIPFFDLIYHVYLFLISLVPASAENVQWK